MKQTDVILEIRPVLPDASTCVDMAAGTTISKYHLGEMSYVQIQLYILVAPKNEPRLHHFCFHWEQGKK